MVIVTIKWANVSKCLVQGLAHTNSLILLLLQLYIDIWVASF